MGPRNIGPANMGPRNMGPANMGPRNMGPANMGPGYMVPTNMAPQYSSFNFSRSGNYNQTNFFNPFMNSETYQQSSNQGFGNQRFTNPPQSQFNQSPYRFPPQFPPNFRPFFSGNKK